MTHDPDHPRPDDRRVREVVEERGHRAPKRLIEGQIKATKQHPDPPAPPPPPPPPPKKHT